MSVGKEATPTYAIIDSQSVKTTSKSEQKGFDGGKKVKGRKRHILVDTIGNLLGVVVHAANIHDTRAGIMVVDNGVCQHSCHPYLNQATKTSLALTRLDRRTGLRAVG